MSKKTFNELVCERESRIIRETREQLKKYEIKVLHKDGLYRHLYCFDPDRGHDCSFHVYTARGIVTVLGDWCDAWTLERMPDMLTQFLNQSAPNPFYWAEKVRNPNKYFAIRENEYEITRAWVHEGLKEYLKGEKLQEAIIKADWDIPYDDNSYYVIDALERCTFWYENCEYQLQDYLPEIWDCAWEVYTEEWLRVCEMLRWTAVKTLEMETAQ